MTPSMHKVSDLKVGDIFSDYIKYGQAIVLDSQHKIIEIRRELAPVYGDTSFQYFSITNTTGVSHNVYVEEQYIVTSRIYNRHGVLFGAQTDVYSKNEYFLKRELIKLNEERKKITITVGDLV